jgi:hypothetical protein
MRGGIGSFVRMEGTRMAERFLLLVSLRTQLMPRVVRLLSTGALGQRSDDSGTEVEPGARRRRESASTGLRT